MVIVAGAPYYDPGQGTRGGSIILPSPFLPILIYFSIIFFARTQKKPVAASVQKVHNYRGGHSKDLSGTAGRYERKREPRQAAASWGFSQKLIHHYRKTISRPFKKIIVILVGKL